MSERKLSVIQVVVWHGLYEADAEYYLERDWESRFIRGDDIAYLLGMHGDKDYVRFFLGKDKTTRAARRLFHVLKGHGQVDEFQAHAFTAFDLFADGTGGLALIPYWHKMTGRKRGFLVEIENDWLHMRDAYAKTKQERKRYEELRAKAWSGEVDE